MMKILVKKNITVLKKNILIPVNMLIVLVILISNISGNENSKIGFLEWDTYVSVVYYLIPIFLLILFWEIYWKEFRAGYVKVDMLSGYTRSEIIGAKLMIGSALSILMFLLPFAIIYIILSIAHFNYRVIVLSFDAFVSYVLYCIYFNSAFVAAVLISKVPSRYKCPLFIFEIIMFVLVQVFFAYPVMTFVRFILFMGLNIFSLIITVKVFNTIDL